MPQQPTDKKEAVVLQPMAAGIGTDSDYESEEEAAPAPAPQPASNPNHRPMVGGFGE